MNRSESIKNLAVALNKFQAEVTNPKKTEINSFHKSGYAPLNSVIDHIRPTLAECGLSFFQSTAGDGEKSAVITLVMHSSGEWIESDPLYLKNFISKGDNPAQAGGVSLTYARRYSLEAALGISSEKDTDGNPPEKGARKKKNNYSGKNNNKSENPYGIDKPGEVVVKFGQYKGEKLKDIPEDGLHEIHDKTTTEFYRDAVKAEIARRNKTTNKRILTARERKLKPLIVNDEASRTVREYLAQASIDLNKKIECVDDLPEDKFDDLWDYMSSIKADYDRVQSKKTDDLLPEDFEVPF